jgi:dTDP-4-amino-4,6-dideoxygalactose transaminase
LTRAGAGAKDRAVADTTPIPMLDLKAQQAPLRAELLAAMERVVDGTAFIMGPDVPAFEKEVAAALEVKHAIGCANGSDALVIALQALGIQPGDEVITSTFSFFATAGSISRLGAKPVFVDIDPDSYNLDPSLIEARIGPRTRAIMPVHLYGQMTPMGPIMDLAKRRGLKVVEDGAQAIGAKEGSRFAGTVGEIGTLSFFPSKNLGGFGDGGMMLTNDDLLAERMRSIRVHGGSLTQRYFHDEVGLNSRLDTLQAAVLRVKLPHLFAWSEGRRKNAAIYDALLADVPGVKRPIRRAEMTHIYNQYTIRVPARDKLEARLKAEKIGCAVYYPLPLHLQRCFADLGGKPGDCPKAEKAAAEVLSLPVYGELTRAQIERIVSVVREHAKAHA